MTAELPGGEFAKKVLRAALKLIVKLPFRGRFLLVRTLGPLLKPKAGIGTTRIGSYPIELDHRQGNPLFMAYGLYEVYELRVLRGLLRKGDVVLDVGGNIGYMAAHFANWTNPGGRVYSFEPSRQCLASLNALAAASAGSITVVACAVGDRATKQRYYDTDVVVERGFGVVEYEPDHNVIGSYEVDVVRLDDWTESAGLTKIALIKVDVEGYEIKVIAGMRGIFARGWRPTILVESDFRAANKNNSAFTFSQTLLDLGYLAFDCYPRLHPIDIRALRAEARLNVLWIHKER